MKKRFLFCLALGFFGWPNFLYAQTISVGGSSLSFDDPITSNPSTTVGGICVYNDVVTVGATSYDAIVSIDVMTNALISDFDLECSHAAPACVSQKGTIKVEIKLDVRHKNMEILFPSFERA